MEISQTGVTSTHFKSLGDMKNPIKYIMRRLALRKNRSKREQKIIPLSRIRRVAVFIDVEQKGANTAEIWVREFFSSIGVKLFILKPKAEELNYAGFLHKKYRQIDLHNRKEELFISLSSNPENFAAEYEARCSQAVFKVGCCNYTNDIFDMIVNNPPDKQHDQKSVFKAMTTYLMKIK